MILCAGTADQITAHARREAPVEACGYLAGTGDDILYYFPMTNTEKKTDHFRLDPREQFAAWKEARNRGLNILGIYHSHPSSPAWPSEEDIRLAYDPTLVYVIVSIMEGKRTMRGFRITKGSVREEPLIIRETQQ